MIRYEVSFTAARMWPWAAAECEAGDNGYRCQTVTTETVNPGR